MAWLTILRASRLDQLNSLLGSLSNDDDDAEDDAEDDAK